MDHDWSKLCGFNYMPSYSAHLQYTWTHFQPEVWEREVPWALRFGSNCLRLWLDWSAFLAVGDAKLDALDRALCILDANGLKAMPVLFNRWTDQLYPAGGVPNEVLLRADYGFRAFRPYVEALADRFGKDERILCWDLCNEPQAPWEAVDVNLKEFAWLAWASNQLRQRATQPITIGTMFTDNVRLYAPLVDVISFHPYTRKLGEMTVQCEAHLAIAAEYGKPLIATECCVGSLDDYERGLLAKDSIETLERFGIGWQAWQMVSGRFVTGSRERTDCNATRPWEGYMPFVLLDGTTRPYHEWLEER